MANEDTSEKSPQPNKIRKVRRIIIASVTLGVVAIGAVLIFQEFKSAPRPNYDHPQANLANVFLACNAYWDEKGSENNCTPAVASQQEYGYIQSANVNIFASGTKTGFSATAQHIDSTKTFSIDSNGTITEVD